MQNCPGISWGPNDPINLFRTSIGWVAAYYDNEYSHPEIIRVFKPKDFSDYYAMKSKIAWYNYHTDRLCPLVAMQMNGPIKIGNEKEYFRLINKSKLVREQQKT